MRRHDILRIERPMMEKLIELSSILKDLSLMLGSDKPAAANWIDESRQSGVDVRPGMTLGELYAAVNRQLDNAMRQ